MNPDRAVNAEDFRWMARRRLPRIAFDYIEGGVDDERGMDTNRSGFLKYHLVPRYLVDVDNRSQNKALFGRQYSSPFGFAPTGTMGLFRPNSEFMLAEAAAKANIPYIMSGASNASMDAAAKIAPNHLWYQLYAAKDKQINEDFVRRADQLDLEGLVVTVDVPVRTRRERNIRNGFSLDHRMKPAVFLEALTHPAWIIDYLRHGGVPPLANWIKYAPKGANPAEIARFFNDQVPAPSQTWRDLEAYRKTWPRKLVVKGIMHPDDAIRAIDIGVDGIIVSNHGGRQLDRAPATVDVFPSIREAVNGRATLMLDSGVRRGSDILIALCLGADFVFLGRSVLYAVSACGSRGVAKLIEILRAEIDLNLGQLGCQTLRELGPDRLWRNSETLCPVK